MRRTRDQIIAGNQLIASVRRSRRISCDVASSCVVVIPDVRRTSGRHVGWRRETVEGEKPLGGSRFSEPGISIASLASLFSFLLRRALPLAVLRGVSSRFLSSSVLSKPRFPVIILVPLLSPSLSFSLSLERSAPRSAVMVTPEM